MTNLFLLLILESIIFSLVFLFTDRDVLSPSCIMCAMFVVSTIFALLNVNQWRIDFGFSSLMIISSGLLVAVITELFCKTFWQRKSIISEDIDDNHPISIRNYVVILFIAFNIVVSYLYFRAIRSIVGNSSSIGMMFAMYRNMGVDDLAGRATERVGGLLNQLLKITKATGYVGIYVLIYNILNGGKEKAKQNILLGILCVTSLLHAVMIASRGGILMYLSNILIVYYILWHQKKGWGRNLSWKVIKYGIIGIIIGIPVFYYSAFLIGRKNTLNIMDYVSTYIGGSIALFDLYLKDPIPAVQFGEESLFNLKKIFNALGFGSASTSYNLESRYLGSIRSNVYTFFRRPLHDFGLFGMYVFTILVIILFCWIYYRKIRWKEKTTKTDCWVLIYGYLYYWMFVSSILQYSVSYVSFGCVTTIVIILVLYLLITKVRLKFGGS